MALGTFKGGIHPNDAKSLAKDQPIQALSISGEYVYPLSQHIGAPATPAVEVGDKVLVGQKIATASSFISAHVISSVSGIVKAIEKRPTLTGEEVESIIVENDEQYEVTEGFGREQDYKQLSKEEIREQIKEAGIVGCGGAGFPTHVKVTPKDDGAIEYVIVNGAECEPYLTTDYRLMLERPEQIVEGLRIVLQLFEKAKGVIGIEDNKPEVIQKFQALLAKESNMKVAVLKTKYPQGGERSLIAAITGRKVNSEMLPSDVGCIVSNVGSIAAIYQAVSHRTPLISRIVTVSGGAATSPGNYEVRIGCSAKKLIDQAHGFKGEPSEVVSGGPMMGRTVNNLEGPVIKTTTALLGFTSAESGEYETTACIRCTKCVQVCPSRIMPFEMVGYTDRNDYAGFEKVNGMECMECGCCSYVCPARIKLTPSFAKARKVILMKRAKQKK